MQKQLVAKFQVLKSMIGQWFGPVDRPQQKQFSKSALLKASRQYIKLAVQRGEWVSDDEVCEHINADWRAGTFIRKEFNFNACIKDGRSYLYNKKALLALAKELEVRNVDLKRYMEYKKSESEFQKKIAANKKSLKGRRPFEIPAGLKDIRTSAPPAPDVDIVKKDLERLKTEFAEQGLADYIDIYHGNHAMLKYLFHFQKYIDPQVKGRCFKWCEDFNYANHALELIIKKTQDCIPVAGEGMMQRS